MVTCVCTELAYLKLWIVVLQEEDKKDVRYNGTLS